MAALLLVGCGGQAPEPVPQPPEPSQQGETAAAIAQNTKQFPPLRVPLVDGGIYELSTNRGKWVVVNFWATWCATCVKEMPELSALHDAHDNISVLGLAYETIEPEALRKALAKRPVSYQIAIVDPYELPAGLTAPRGLPMTYLIDPQGNVKREFLGPVTRADLERAIAAT